MADLGSQAIIHCHLKKNFPQDQMIAEETSTSLQDFKQVTPFLTLLSETLHQSVTLQDVSHIQAIKVAFYSIYYKY